MKIKEIKKCRICGNRDLIPILNLGVQALSGRFPIRDEPDPPKAPLELVKCNNTKNTNACGLLQLKHSVSPEELYLHNYGYRSGINQTMRLHLQGIVQHIQEIINLHEGDVVLDIGSNDATFLKYYKTSGLRKIGIDPVGEQFLEYYTKDIELINDYFNSSNYSSVCPDKQAKVITSIAMFYDLETPMNFVEDIKKILHPDGIWILEQSYMPTMLEMNSFDTICHEHLEYYSLKQIDWILRKNDLRIFDIEFNDINGGSFRVYVCHDKSVFKSNQKKINQVFSKEEKLKLDSEQPYKEFTERVFHMKDELYNFLTTEKAKGKSIYVYGASTKGNVLLQFCNIDYILITAAADRNPEKWGCRTPGTNIPIISEEDAREAKPDYFLVLPWHFRQEFIKRETDFLASGGKFIFPLPKIKINGCKPSYFTNVDKMIPWAKPYFFGNEKDFLLKALHSTWISGGEYVNKFESDFARLIGRKYAVTTSNGTTALHLALMGVGVGPGDEVIVPGFTFVAAANTVLQTGAQPVYVDVDSKTWCLDVNEVEKSITDKTKAIIPVHIYGNVCDMRALMKIAKDYDLIIIEDVAEAVFSKYRGKFAGSFGDLACFSFHATKTITMGEGGAVLTDEEKLNNRMRIMRSHGMRETKRYWHDVVGYNYRLTNLQAGLGCAQLENADKIIKEKMRVYQKYLENLSDVPGIEFQHISNEVKPIIWAVAIKINPKYFKGDRNFLIRELLKRNIETRPGFYPFSIMPLYNTSPLPISESISKNIISLPSYPSLSYDDIDYICHQLKSLMGKDHVI